MTEALMLKGSNCGWETMEVTLDTRLEFCIHTWGSTASLLDPGTRPRNLSRRIRIATTKADKTRVATGRYPALHLPDDPEGVLCPIRIGWCMNYIAWYLRWPDVRF